MQGSKQTRIFVVISPAALYVTHQTSVVLSDYNSLPIMPTDYSPTQHKTIKHSDAFVTRTFNVITHTHAIHEQCVVHDYSSSD